MADNTRFIRDPGGTVYDLAGGYLDPISSPEEFAKRSGTTDIQGASQLVGNPQDYLANSFRTQAQNRYLPQQDLALQGLAQAKVGVDQDVTDTNRQYDQLGQQLQDAAMAGRGQLTEQANRYGLLSSGLTAAGLGKIESDTSLKTQQSAQDRASSLAKLALQRAGLTTQESGVKLQTAQSIDDLVGQLLSGSTEKQRQAFQEKLQLANLASGLPEGQTLDIGGQKVTGTQKAKLDTIDLGNKVVMVDAAGKVVATYAKGSLGGGSAGTATERSANALQAAIQSYAGDVRVQAGDQGSLTREQLIRNLQGMFPTTDVEVIKSAVYNTLQAPGEKAYVPKKAAGPLTADQTKAAGFANRLQQSGDIIDGLTPRLTAMNPLLYLEQRKSPNLLQYPDIQQELQAEQNFVNAILRRESGAAISQSEYDNASKQYFPQPGDSPQVLAQKKANRSTALQSLAGESGGAFSAAPAKSNDPLGVR